MLSETLNDRIEQYRIGPKVRALRSAKGLGLAQLGAHTGMSAGMLSKIETGQIVPTLPTLTRIALVFGVGLEHFFAAPVEPILEIVRQSERIRLPNPPGASPAYFFESLDFPVAERPIEAYLGFFEPGAPISPPHRHDGVEIIYVIEGELILSIHGRRQRLETGDSIYFDADHDHSYSCGGAEPCRTVVAVSATC
jgi:transcriptional regulator with XRE-family HTH domain